MANVIITLCKFCFSAFMLGVLISLKNFLFFDIVDVKLFWKAKKKKKNQNLMIFDALIHLMHLIVEKETG